MSADPFAESAVTPERLGLAAFVLMVPVFAYLGHTLFEDVLFGGLVGVVFGAGSLLEVPYFVRRAAIEEGDASVDAMAGEHARRAAWGMGLTVGGFVALSGRFVADGEVLRPLLVGAVVVVLLAVPLGRALPSLSAIEEPRG